MLVRKEVLLTGLCERKILFRLEIYYRLRQATVKRTDCRYMVDLDQIYDNNEIFNNILFHDTITLVLLFFTHTSKTILFITIILSNNTRLRKVGAPSL